MYTVTCVYYEVVLTECLDEGGVTLAGESDPEWQDGAYREEVGKVESHSSILTPVLHVLQVVGLFLGCHGIKKNLKRGGMHGLNSRLSPSLSLTLV